VAITHWRQSGTITNAAITGERAIREMKEAFNELPEQHLAGKQEAQL